jgi:hypothetical protein
MTNNFKIILAGILVFQVIFFVIGGIIIKNLNAGRDVSLISARKEDLLADQQKLLAIVADLNKTIELESAKLNTLKAIANQTPNSIALLKAQELLAQKSKEAAANPPSLPVSTPTTTNPPVVTRAS